MIDKLKLKVERYNFLCNEIAKPKIISNNNEYKKLAKEQASLQTFVDLYNDYNESTVNLDNAKEQLRNETDTEIRSMLDEEIDSIRAHLEKLDEDIKIALLPKDEDDEKNVIIEIRGGAGGDEAALFAMELMRMYMRFAEKQRFKVNVLSTSETGIGGLKEGTMTISGHGVYSKFKFESGVHRVQRVPETESGGRIHTSTVTVAVLPEAEDVDFDLKDEDLQIDVFRSSGAGGQKVNKTSSAIRVTHIPTGMVVECQDERSQYKNKDRALKVLKSRLLDIENQKQHESIANERKSQVGTGDRSERIRTYNFPQGRVTDHRIGLTIYKILQIMDGDIDEIIDALITADTAEKLKASEEN